MTFTVPNQGVAAFTDQAQVDSGDFAIIAAAPGGTGVVSGCAVTSTGTGNGSVAVAAGVVRINDALVTVAGATVALAANATGNPRYDLITVTTAGTPTVVAGTAAASPVFPAIPASRTVLAVVRVPAGHTATTTVPAATIVDKAMSVPAALGTTATADRQIQHRDPSKIGIIIKGVDDPSNFVKPILQVDDKNDAPIWWVLPVGGMNVNDDLATLYTVFGPVGFKADIYGFQWNGTRCTFSFPGPPGNMLRWHDACHEAYQTTRLPTTGSWGVVAACTLSTFDFGSPPTGSPTGYRSGIRISQNAAGSAWISMPGGAIATPGVTTGMTISAVAMLRNNAATARNATVRITWLTAAGAAVGADINSTATSLVQGVWTRVSIDNITAPATAARVQIHILVAGAASETYDVAGVGIMKGQPVGIFAPPFVAQNPGGPPIANQALAGDRHIRTDTPGVPGQREYVCTTGGVPELQIWAPLDTSDVRRLYRDVQNSTTTLSTIPEFNVPVVAGREYQVDLSLTFTSAATTTGWQFSWNGPAMTRFYARYEYDSSATAVAVHAITSTTMPASHTATAAAYAAGVPIGARFRVHFVPSASGTLTFSHRSAVAASANIVQRGATLTVQ